MSNVRCVLCLGLLACAPAVVLAEGTAANGAVLPMPEIATLHCDAMETVLDHYTQSKYRGLGGIPEDHPDRTLYEYEDALATAYYEQCHGEAIYFNSTSEVFGPGFN